MAQLTCGRGRSREGETQEPSHPAGEGPSTQTEQSPYVYVLPPPTRDSETWRSDHKNSSDPDDPGDRLPSGHQEAVVNPTVPYPYFQWNRENLNADGNGERIEQSAIG